MFAFSSQIAASSPSSGHDNSPGNLKMKPTDRELDGFWARHRQIARDIGWRATLLHIICKRIRTTMQMRLKTPHAKYPLVVRAGTSDVEVFRQIFCECEYACLNDLAQVKTLIDCGANVGYSSAYFLTRFPQCTVLAIEPDRSNFDLLKLNLAPYAGRFQTRCAAVWSRNVGLKVSTPSIHGGFVMAWGIQVAEATDGQKTDTHGTTIPDLIAAMEGNRVSILKIDIEGAEVPVFSEDCRSWLPKVDNIVIELHGDAAEKTFAQAIEGAGYSVSQSGELTICRPDQRLG
jgi:FkbM family methyltransferase